MKYTLVKTLIRKLILLVWEEKKKYIFKCRELPENSNREISNLMEIKDHYHKYVVSKDSIAKGNENGIEIIHIADFLLKDNW